MLISDSFTKTFNLHIEATGQKVEAHEDPSTRIHWRAPTILLLTLHTLTQWLAPVFVQYNNTTIKLKIC